MGLIRAPSKTSRLAYQSSNKTSDTSLDSARSYNNNFSNKVNKMVSLEAIRDKSAHRNRSLQSQKKGVLEHSNLVMAQPKHDKWGNQSSKVKTKVIKFDTYDNRPGPTIPSSIKHVNVGSESMFRLKKSPPDVNNYTDKHMKDILAKNGAVKAQKSKLGLAKYHKNLPMIPRSKIVKDMSLDSSISPRLPTLGPNSTENTISKPLNSPKSKALANSQSPASPPTSTKISLETMLFGPEPKVVDPDLIEFVNHESTKCSIK